MKRQSLKRQAALTMGASVLVRAMGFVMRLGVSRYLGAEAVGVMELALSAQNLALTPAAAGLPGAVSRMTARAKTGEERRAVRAAGRQIALRIALTVTPLFLLFSPLIARWLGDGRTLPSLWLFSPAILLIGVSSVYDGACFGAGNAWPPAVSDLCEQFVRLIVTAGLLTALPHLTVAWRAALPAAATTLAEAAGLAVILLMTGRMRARHEAMDPAPVRRQLWRLSLPLMLNRLCHTALRTLSGVMIPLRLMAAGLSRSESLSRLGMLSGMAMPLMFLPGLLSGALATVGGPAAARCESPRAERRLMRRLVLPSAGAGFLCAGLLYVFAPWLSLHLYRLPELTPLIRTLCPLAVILPVQQVLGGVMTGLGMQKKVLADSLLSAAATLLCTWCWTADPARGIYGAACAALTGHGLALICSFARLIGRNRGK